jgi:hypothetical protein
MTSVASPTGVLVRENPYPDAATAHLQVRAISTFAAFLAAGPAWDLAAKSAAIPHPFLDHGWIRSC